MQLLRDVKVTRVMNSVVAGTSAQNSSVIDMQDFDGVVFVALFGTVTDGSVVTLTVKENTASSTSSPTPTTPVGGPAPTFTGSTSSNVCLAADLYRPLLRYVFAAITRTTQNAVIDGVIAIQYRGRVKPTVQDATTIAASALASGV